MLTLSGTICVVLGRSVFFCSTFYVRSAWWPPLWSSCLKKENKYNNLFGKYVSTFLIYQKTWKEVTKCHTLEIEKMPLTVDFPPTGRYYSFKFKVQPDLWPHDVCYCKFCVIENISVKCFNVCNVLGSWWRRNSNMRQKFSNL